MMLYVFIFLACPSSCSNSEMCLPSCPSRCCKRADLDEYFDDVEEDAVKKRQRIEHRD